MDFTFVLALLTLVIFLISILELFNGIRKINFLKDVSLEGKIKEDKVSVVIPALNEEKKIEFALNSILQQDYENLEVIVINDRSTDGTKAILDRIPATDDKLMVHHLTEVPEGWLGKNHALFYGAKKAAGAYLLFADADVIMDKTAIRRAVIYLQENSLDHIVVGPEPILNQTILKMVMLSFSVSFMLFIKPWKARDPKNKRSIGGGAFSFMRREVYETIGTMQAIPLAVADDLKLGQLIKKHGFKQEFLAGEEMVKIEWYSTLREMIQGLTKNVFAVFDFSFLKITLLAVMTILMFIWPLLALFLTSGLTQMLNGLIVIAILVLYQLQARFTKTPIRFAFGFPIAVMLNQFMIWRSAFLTVINKGIDWRGTHYPIDLLKGNQ